MMGLLVCVLLLGIVEVVLRVCGLPRGLFRGAFATTTGLWEPNFRGDLEFGPYTYRVEANEHGFRGPPLRTGLNAARTRIVCLGDSVTDGFNVDNDATYPNFLNGALDAQGRDVEVINCARAGGSINKEYIIYRDIARTLAPDIAIVLFVTNDITDLGSRTIDQLLKVELQRDAGSSTAEMLVTRTALGEALMDVYLRIRSPHYRREARSGGTAPAPTKTVSSTDAPTATDQRYVIEGNDRYEENARRFMDGWATEDARLLKDPLDDGVLRAVDNYVEILRRLAELCRADGVRLLFVYDPSYPELYLPQPPDRFHNLLEARVNALGIPFFDLTPALQAATKQGPQHLAPVDYHPNPCGYRTIAEAIARQLASLGWLDGA
ncbi:MAG: SGNH/GDSL hydrolase family protein [Phycisphaerales bacterium]|nr:SGNH/GDSL hydrolase family protein [Phycisphaerales bacterium]